MFCKNCGHQNDDQAKFCSSCGANLAAQQAETITEQPGDQVEQPVAEPEGTVTPTASTNPYGNPGGGVVKGKQTSALSIWSLVLGLVGFFLGWVSCGPLPAIAAIITGHIGLNRIKEAPDNLQGKEMCLVGIIAGYITVGLWVILGVVFVILAVSNQEFGDAFDF
jgi:hypothetical protein